MPVTLAVLIDAAVLVMIMLSRRTITVFVIAVDDMRGHEAVQDSRHYLDDEGATEKANDQDPRCHARRLPALLERSSRGRKHAEQGGEELERVQPRERGASNDVALTMTPLLRLSDEERNALLFWIWKFFLPGNMRTTTSTKSIEAPSMQAARATSACENAAKEHRVGETYRDRLCKPVSIPECRCSEPCRRHRARTPWTGRRREVGGQRLLRAVLLRWRLSIRRTVVLSWASGTSCHRAGFSGKPP